LAQPGPTTGEREVDENKAEVVRSIFAAFASGEPQRAIVKDLNERASPRRATYPEAPCRSTKINELGGTGCSTTRSIGKLVGNP
jgi:hypothetical protein